MQSSAFAYRVVRDQVAVGKGEHAAWHGDHDFAGRFFVGRIETREPVTRIFILALAPDLPWLAGVAGIRRDEVQATARCAPIGDCDGESRSDLQRRAKIDAQLLAVAAKLARPIVGRGDCEDVQLDGVQLDELGRLGEHREAQAGNTANLRAVSTGIDLEF